MIDYLPATAAAVLTPLITLALARSLRRSSPLQGDERAGTIRPDRWIAALAVGIAAIMCIGGIAMMAFTENMVTGIMLSLLGAFIGVGLIPALTPIATVHWSDSGIEGPSKTVCLITLGLGRTKISWDDIAAIGGSSANFWYIQSTDHRRVYWSYLHKGYGALTAALRANRPDLTLPNDMS